MTKVTAGGPAPISDASGSLLVAVQHGPLLDPLHDTVSLGPNPTGGATPFLFRNTAAWTLQTVKTQGGTVFGWEVSNASGATVYVAWYDLAAPVPGTTAPVLYAIAPAGGTVVVPQSGLGTSFQTAITLFAATTDNGTVGAPAGVTVSARYA